MAEEIPVYKIGINADDERTGVKVVSFVSAPAIETGFIALSKQKKESKFVALADDAKQIITGPALIPDIEILRISKDDEFYKIVFTKEAIEGINKKFFKEGNIFNTNFEHEGQLDGNFIIESWLISDKDNDKAKALGFDLPVGTWMLSYYIPDLKLYQEIKEEASGFSIEGRFILDELLNKHKKTKMANVNKNLFEKVMKVLKPLFLNEEEVDDAGEVETKLNNLSDAFAAQINTWLEEAGIDRTTALNAMAEATEIGVEEVTNIVDGLAGCPTEETVRSLAGAIPGSDADALLAAWSADGCGEEEEAPEEEAEKAAPVIEQKEVVEENAELAELKETVATLTAKLEALTNVLVERNAELAELKKQPAGEKVDTTPGVEKKETVADLKKLPFHAQYTARLKAINSK